MVLHQESPTTLTKFWVHTEHGLRTAALKCRWKKLNLKK